MKSHFMILCWMLLWEMCFVLKTTSGGPLKVNNDLFSPSLKTSDWGGRPRQQYNRSLKNSELRKVLGIIITNVNRSWSTDFVEMNPFSTGQGHENAQKTTYPIRGYNIKNLCSKVWQDTIVTELPFKSRKDHDGQILDRLKSDVEKC